MSDLSNPAERKELSRKVSETNRQSTHKSGKAGYNASSAVQL